MAIVKRMEKCDREKINYRSKPKYAVYTVTKDGLQIKTTASKESGQTDGFKQNIFFTGEALEQLREALKEIDKLNGK